jgi:hypothetical protein
LVGGSSAAEQAVVNRPGVGSNPASPASLIVNLYRLTLPDEEPPGLKPNFNVAPTHVMPIIRPAGNGRELVMAGWLPSVSDESTFCLQRWCVTLA